MGKLVPDRMTEHDLDRFLVAQEGAYDDALGELRAGRKTGHWIWFIFPQVAGLGRSAVSQHFSVVAIDEARDYLGHPILGPRLRECCAAILAIKGRSAIEIFGSLDAMKVRSSMTLFHRADPDESVFGQVLDLYYGGLPDPATDALLG